MAKYKADQASGSSKNFNEIHNKIVAKLPPCPPPGSGVSRWRHSCCCTLVNAGFADADIEQVILEKYSRQEATEKSLRSIRRSIKGARSTSKTAQSGASKLGAYQDPGASEEKKPVRFPARTRKAIEIPEGSAEMFLAHLSHNYTPEDYVLISGGESHDRFKGELWCVGDLIDELEGTPDRRFWETLGQAKDGLYIKINPIKPDWKNTHSKENRCGPKGIFETTDGTPATDVANFSLVVFEGDDTPDKPFSPKEQIRVMQESGVPVKAIISSGDASLHFHVAIDAGKDRTLYQQRVNIVKDHVAPIAERDGYTFDVTQDEVRWTRAGGGLRLRRGKKHGHTPLGQDGKGAIQRVVALYDAQWEDPEPIDKSADLFHSLIISTKDILKEQTESPYLINGLIREGELGVTAAPTKIGKTWFQMEMALHIASGKEFLGMTIDKPRSVLFINAELKSITFGIRTKWLMERCNITSEDIGDRYYSATLRAHSYSLAELIRILKRGYEQGNYNFSAIFIDPIYKIYGDLDENSNTDMAALMTCLIQFAEVSNATIFLTDHHAKGARDWLIHYEQMAGAGTKQRAPDTIVNLAPLQDKATSQEEEPDILYKMTAIHRSGKSPEPKYLTWNTNERRLTEADDTLVDEFFKTATEKKEEEQSEKRKQRETHCASCVAEWKHFWRDFGSGERQDLINYLTTHCDHAEELRTGKGYKDPLDTSASDWSTKLVENIKRYPSHYALLKNQVDGNTAIYTPIQ